MMLASSPASASSEIRSLDQLPLGGHQEHRHLKPLAFRVEDLEIEFDVLHVEWHVLFGLPPDDLAGLRLRHPIHLDLLDDDVAPPDRRHDRLLFDRAAATNNLRHRVRRPPGP